MACPNIPLPVCHWLDNMKISMLCFLQPVQNRQSKPVVKRSVGRKGLEAQTKKSRRQKAFESTLVKLTQHVAKPPA